MLNSKKHLIVSRYPGLVAYIRKVLITEKAIKQQNLEVEVEYKLDEDNLEEQLGGKHVYGLEKLSFGEHAIDVTKVKVTLEKLGKPLKEATAYEIVLTNPDVTTRVVHKEDKNQEARELEKRFLEEEGRDHLPERPDYLTKDDMGPPKKGAKVAGMLR